MKTGAEMDDDAEAADARHKAGDARDARDSRDNRSGQGKKDKKGKWNKDKKQKGQNASRSFGFSRDKIQLCGTRQNSPEFSPKECPFGDKCRFTHDLRKYLEVGRRADLTIFDGKCPVFEAKGFCHLGWKCRFHLSHSTERETEDGRKELVLIDNTQGKEDGPASLDPEHEVGVVNIVPKEAKINLSRRRTGTPKSDAYIKWTNEVADSDRAHFDNKPKGADRSVAEDADGDASMEKEDNRARFVEPPFRPSEKRRLYYGPETPILAPLTTQGNMPFRRLCVELGAQVTWSEMAMGLPLIQGEKGEWALMKAHESETRPVKFEQKNTVVRGYDNSKDIKFGVQIAANKPWLATKTVEVLTSLCPQIRAIDLNCGCPINLVCEQGAGSALLDSPSKLENVLRGMNYVSGEVPISVKIRMGTKDGQPTAEVCRIAACMTAGRSLILTRNSSSASFSVATKLLSRAKALQALQPSLCTVAASSSATRGAQTGATSQSAPHLLVG
jgi:tRNA-dihydrouridine synthase 3